MSFKQIHRSDQSVQDVLECAMFIQKDNPDVAQRFLESVEKTCQQITSLPEIGSQRQFRQPVLKGIRSWKVQGFENYLIFYRLGEKSLEIVRVLHGARNLKKVFWS